MDDGKWNKPKNANLALMTCNYYYSEYNQYHKQNLQKQCQSPELELPNWSFDCKSKNQYTSGTKCIGTCQFNDNIQLNVECLESGKWWMPDNVNDIIKGGNIFEAKRLMKLNHRFCSSTPVWKCILLKV